MQASVDINQPPTTVSTESPPELSQQADSPRPPPRYRPPPALSPRNAQDSHRSGIRPRTESLNGPRSAIWFIVALTRITLCPREDRYQDQDAPLAKAFAQEPPTRINGATARLLRTTHCFRVVAPRSFWIECTATGPRSVDKAMLEPRCGGESNVQRPRHRSSCRAKGIC